MAPDLIDKMPAQIISQFNRYILLPENIIQMTVIIVIFTFSFLVNNRIESKIKNLIENKLNKLELDFQEKANTLIETLTFPLMFTILLWAYVFLAINFYWPYQIVNITVQILSAWMIIRFMFSFFKNRFIIHLFSSFILAIVVLNILNIYDQTINLLNNIAFNTGKIRISLLLIIQGIFLLSVFMWAAAKITSFIEKKIKDNQSLNPSLQVLINKFIRFIIFGFAIIISLNSLGVDLTAFTVLGGAIGVGIGFGLQNIVSNFISGIIILIDKSIKPGDVIEIDDTYGWISSLNSRFVSIVTLDGEEYLIPNEDFITKKVVNLSYSDKLIRLEISVGISYNSDVEKAMKLVEAAAKNNNRVPNIPEPSCLLTGFGESSINLKLRFWISDPEKGLDNIKSQIFLAIWKAFQQHDIEIPFPQHDLHLQSTPAELDKNENSSEFKTTEPK